MDIIVIIVSILVGMVIGILGTNMAGQYELSQSWENGYNHAVNSMRQHGYWQEQYGKGPKHYGQWYDDPSERNI